MEETEEKKLKSKENDKNESQSEYMIKREPLAEENKGNRESRESEDDKKNDCETLITLEMKKTSDINTFANKVNTECEKTNEKTTNTEENSKNINEKTINTEFENTEETTIITNDNNINIDTLREAIINLAIESWRFSAVYERLLTKINASEQNRYLSQYRWFIKRVDDTLARVNLNLVTVVGREYEPGMPATPLNLDEFEPNDTLIVDQMLEPIIVGKNGLVRSGTVTLRKLK
jgi:hypothetical protein